MAPLNYNDRTQNLYLAKPSYINITTHKTGSYLSSDTIHIQVQYDYVPGSGQNDGFRTIYRNKANSSDTTIKLQAVYGHAVGGFFHGTLELYFKSEILRNGSLLPIKIDSTNVIQFGTQNFPLNY